MIGFQQIHSQGIDLPWAIILVQGASSANKICNKSTWTTIQRQKNVLKSFINTKLQFTLQNWSLTQPKSLQK